MGCCRMVSSAFRCDHVPVGRDSVEPAVREKKLMYWRSWWWDLVNVECLMSNGGAAFPQLSSIVIVEIGSRAANDPMHPEPAYLKQLGDMTEFQNFLDGWY